MASTRLKTNPTKSEYLWCATARRHHHIDISTFRLADGDVVPTTYVLNVGAYSDASMSMATHVNRLVSTCFYQLRRVRAILRSTPTSTAVQLINSFVISRIDYCSSLLAGLPAYQLNRVQSILNISARLIYGRAKYYHVTRMLQDKLQWLRVPERIQYNSCLLVYKYLLGLAPSYISNFCIRVQLSDRRSSLRSATRSHNKLVVPRSNTFDEGSFTISGPSIWISLPDTSYQPHLLTLSKIDLKLICLLV